MMFIKFILLQKLQKVVFEVTYAHSSFSDCWLSTIDADDVCLALWSCECKTMLQLVQNTIVVHVS
jgi:hypothetical protein